MQHDLAAFKAFLITSILRITHGSPPAQQRCRCIFPPPVAGHCNRDDVMTAWTSLDLGRSAHPLPTGQCRMAVARREPVGRVRGVEHHAAGPDDRPTWHPGWASRCQSWRRRRCHPPRAGRGRRGRTRCGRRARAGRARCRDRADCARRSYGRSRTIRFVDHDSAIAGHVIRVVDDHELQTRLRGRAAGRTARA
jgi:hypothetical protein